MMVMRGMWIRRMMWMRMRMVRMAFTVCCGSLTTSHDGITFIWNAFHFH